MNSTDSRNTKINRRRFVQGIASAGVLAALSGDDLLGYGESVSEPLAELSGKHFELTIDKLPVNFTGHRSRAIGVNGSSPGPTLRWKEGDTVTIAVKNRLSEPGSIHWHGMRISADMDGVPGLSYPGIAHDETFVYKFPVRQNGTYWYHSHTQFQEQQGLLGAIVIEPRREDAIQFDREYVVLLSDWTDANPETILSNLKQQSDYYNYHRFTLPNFIRTSAQDGFGSTLRERLTWARMNA